MAERAPSARLATDQTTQALIDPRGGDADSWKKAGFEGWKRRAESLARVRRQSAAVGGELGHEIHSVLRGWTSGQTARFQRRSSGCCQRRGPALKAAQPMAGGQGAAVGALPCWNAKNG